MGRQLQPLQHLQRVVAHRDARRRDHELHAAISKVEDAVDAGRVRARHDHDERVPREDDRLRAQPFPVKGAREGHVRGGEHVRGRALSNLGSEGVRAGE